MEKQYYETVDVSTGELPKENGRYFVICDGKFQDGNIFIDGEFLGDSEIGKTTHWLRPVNLSNEKELYQWVKASERLPEKHGVYHLRKPSKDTNGWHGWYSFVPIKSAIDKDVWVMEQWEWLEKVNLSNHDREVASKAWDAAVEHTRDLSSHPPITPSKETYINNL